MASYLLSSMQVLNEPRNAAPQCIQIYYSWCACFNIQKRSVPEESKRNALLIVNVSNMRPSAAAKRQRLNLP